MHEAVGGCHELLALGFTTRSLASSVFLGGFSNEFARFCVAIIFPALTIIAVFPTGSIKLGTVLLSGCRLVPLSLGCILLRPCFGVRTVIPCRFTGV